MQIGSRPERKNSNSEKDYGGGAVKRQGERLQKYSSIEGEQRKEGGEVGREEERELC